MKRRLVELVCCPVCRGALGLTVLHESEAPVAAPVAPPGPACNEWCELRRLPLAETRPAPDARECTACYGREIDEGLLACQACGGLYPIVRGVPRLVRNAELDYRDFFEHYRAAIREATGREPAAGSGGRQDPGVFDQRSNDSFGLQWTNQSEDDKTWFKDDAALRKDEFLYSLNVAGTELPGALILDAGCGNGRLTASLADFGAEIVGMDLSAGIERAQASKQRYAGERHHFVHFVQGNVMELPVRAGCFDIIHSSGVLHHTPSTERAFASFLAAARPGGRVYAQLYRRREAWVGIPNAVLRGLTSRLPPRLLYRLCWAAVPLHTALVLVVARLRGERSPIGAASRGERALSLFDNFSPRYQYRYRPQDMRRMFEAAGLTEIAETTLANEARHMVAFAARKPERA
jgi:2-polyprenyl-3-methyl-5-hydroxy-6-metoxy-1,4-benzoquinol methylase/uncharacterized protein YbaR (Trm112 family)